MPDDLRISELTATVTVASGDEMPIVDKSDVAMAASGSTRKVTIETLATAVAAVGSLATDAEVTSAISTHAGASDPHGDRAHAAGLVTTHEAAGDPHPGYVLNAELTAHTGATTGAHGMSAFGASLVDDASAAAARTTLELGTAATAAQTDLLARANHTGTQAASTISDFAEAARDTLATALVAGSNVTITVNDPADTITIAATGGGGSFAFDDSAVFLAAQLWS